MLLQPGGQSLPLLRKRGKPFFQNFGFGLAADPLSDHTLMEFLWISKPAQRR
jgi:hypothetical protein